MTEKYFYEDAYLRRFCAEVTGCSFVNGVYEISLSGTAFYPEGGGQPGDRGTLDQVRVEDTVYRGEEIVHLCREPLPVGKTVVGEIAWERRFDFMQQHTGEHIVCGLAHETYGYENVGFHMGAETVTMDLSGPLSFQQAKELEQRANEVIWADLEVLQHYPSEEERKQTTYRSKKELSGWVRLIEIPGVDTCACCGMHVARTGELGLIQILQVEKFHDGTRVEMVSGARAYRFASMNGSQNLLISQSLSAQLFQTSEHVKRLLEEKAALEYQMFALQNQWMQLLAAQQKGNNPALLIEPNLDSDGVRRLCNALLTCCSGVCAAFSGNDAEGYRYAVAGLEPERLREMNAALSGRGGGKNGFAQGTVHADAAQIRAWFC